MRKYYAQFAKKAIKSAREYGSRIEQGQAVPKASALLPHFADNDLLDEKTIQEDLIRLLARQLTDKQRETIMIDLAAQRLHFSYADQPGHNHYGAKVQIEAMADELFGFWDSKEKES